jgi:hypothetical protein
MQFLKDRRFCSFDELPSTYRKIIIITINLRKDLCIDIALKTQILKERVLSLGGYLMLPIENIRFVYGQQTALTTGTYNISPTILTLS